MAAKKQISNDNSPPASYLFNLSAQAFLGPVTISFFSFGLQRLMQFLAETLVGVFAAKLNVIIFFYPEKHHLSFTIIFILFGFWSG